MFGFRKKQPLEKYLSEYINSEKRFREMYGEVAYISVPLVYEKDGAPLPVAPWGNYFGAPLVLPDPEFVKIISITTLDETNQPSTIIRNLKDVVNLLHSHFGVKKGDNPSHLYIYFGDKDDCSSLHTQFVQLPNYTP